MNKKEFIKTLLEPVLHNKKWNFLNFVISFFNKIHIIFLISLGSSIISSLEAKNIANFKFYLTLMIGVIILKIFFRYFQDIVREIKDWDNDIYIYKKYLKKYIYLDNTKIEAYWTWKFTNIINKWCDSWWTLIYLYNDIIVDIITITYAFVVIAFKVPNFYYFIGFVWLFVFVMGLFYKWVTLIKKASIISKEVHIKIDSKTTMILMSKFEILQNDKIDEEIASVNELKNQLKNLWRKTNAKKWLRQLGWVMAIEWMRITTYIVVWIGVINWYYNIAYLALLIWLINELYNYSWSIRWYIRDISLKLVDFNKLIDVFNNTKKYEENPNLLDFKFKKWEIELKNICFGYSEDRGIFDNFSTKLEWGKKYALVWPSWSGKTTLMKIIAKYIDINSWNIIIDWQDLNEVSIKSYYKNIGYLTQEPNVFDGKIIDNLTYALKHKPSNEELQNIIKLSKCEFINELPNWLDTEIGERWVRLSWWQKQRLAIAKIMLKNANIILLDEPTSALDSISESHVAEALHNLFVGRTVIIIAHRLQTVKEADIIFYMEHGKIIESGSHSNLVELNWKYKNMLDVQTGF